MIKIILDINDFFLIFKILFNLNNIIINYLLFSKIVFL